MKCKRIEQYTEYTKSIKAKRLLVNKFSNDWNNEPNYKLQNILILGEKDNKFVVTSSGNKYGGSFLEDKTRIFININDLKQKLDVLDIDEYEKKQLVESWINNASNKFK